jgi:hypothetical protein
LTGVFVDVLAEADVDQEVAVVGRGLERRDSLVSRPCLDVGTKEFGSVPAAEGDGVGVFVVEGGAKGDDAGDL